MQFSVAAFAGMALATMVPPVRRSVPRWMEAFIWLGLIVTCWLAITKVQHTNTRFLTESVAWGANQIVNASVGLVIGDVRSWLSDYRFVIANGVVTLVGADVLLLALLHSHRKGVGWQPRILLGEWFEVPLHRAPALALVPVPYALDEWNRRAERATAMLGAAILPALVQMLVWARDVPDRAARGDAKLAKIGPIVPAPPSLRLVEGEGQASGSDRLAS